MKNDKTIKENKVIEKISVERINSYEDKRFSENILLQHGAFVINENILYEIEIVDKDSAFVYGNDRKHFEEVIEKFHFYAEHISKFYDKNKKLIKEYEEVNTFDIDIRDIQPSQFYIDKTKKEAVSSFIHEEDDIVVPLIRYKNRYISLDGHTRISVGIDKGFSRVKGFITNSYDYVDDFVKEAELRGIISPKDMIELTHEDYKNKWNKFCEDYFNKI